jgi:hypothetical protein
MVRQSHGVDVGGESGTLERKKLLTRHCMRVSSRGMNRTITYLQQQNARYNLYKRDVYMHNAGLRTSSNHETQCATLSSLLLISPAKPPSLPLAPSLGNTA